MNGTQPVSNTDWRPIHPLLFVALLAAGNFVPAFRLWPMLWLAPLAAYGIGLPIIAHIAADATIFTLITRSGGL